MNRIEREKLEKLNRKLIQKYIDNNDDQKEYLRYLIDKIYDDMVFICNCEKGLVLEHIFGDTSYGKCDNCGKRYHY